MLRLKRTIDQRESFVSCLTHDLRTPLVAANRMLTLMQQKAFGDITGEMNEAIANIISSNQNLLQMLNSLLEVHHYEVGQKILSFITFDIKELILEVIRELQPLAREKNLELKSNLLEEIETIKGDRLELRRVLTNLISNAIKFTDKGFVQVNLQQENKQILIQVQDTGMGIPPEEQKTIFERYHQGKHRRSGKGLGLYLCQQIIDAHYGKITFQSQLGKGTTFSLSLPQLIPSQTSMTKRS
jgi:signal transduction histidine kinase